MSVKSTNGGWRPRSKDRYPPGTVIYSWCFTHPKWGPCGGADNDDWSQNKAEIENRMAYCEWPSQLVTAEA